MALVGALSAINLLPLWKRRVNVWGHSLQAVSADRLLYLHLHRFGLMGRSERAALESRVRAGMHVMDIGANLGLYTLLLARLVGPTGSVIAIEPDPELFEALDTNCRINGADHVERIHAAAAARPGSLTLYRSLVNAGDNRVGGHSSSTTRRIDVQARTVDEIAGGRRLDFVKIDVQGWEGEVFRGMKQVIERNPAMEILFEFWPFGLKRAGCDPARMLAELKSLGFAIRSIEENGLNPEKLDGKKYMNLLATPASHAGVCPTGMP